MIQSNQHCIMTPEPNEQNVSSAAWKRQQRLQLCAMPKCTFRAGQRAVAPATFRSPEHMGENAQRSAHDRQLGRRTPAERRVYPMRQRGHPYCSTRGTRTASRGTNGVGRRREEAPRPLRAAAARRRRPLRPNLILRVDNVGRRCGRVRQTRPGGPGHRTEPLQSTMTIPIMESIFRSRRRSLSSKSGSGIDFTFQLKAPGGTAKIDIGRLQPSSTPIMGADHK
jgi:hypothetical protein